MKSIALVLLLVLLGATSASAERLNGLAAVVNDEIITLYQLEEEVTSRLGSDADDQARRKVLDSLVEELLIQQRAKALGLQVADEELEAAIEDIQRENKLTRQQLQAALTAQGIDFEGYRDTMRRQILRFKVIGREVRSKIDVLNKEIRDYYQQNLDAFRRAPFVKVSAIALPFPEKAKEPQRQQVRDEASAILQQLASGQLFADVVASLEGRDDLGAGEMGTFSEGELNPAFDEAIRRLEPGQHSPLVETAAGVSILRLDERQEGAPLPLEEVRESIEEKLRETKANENLKKWAEQLKGQARIDIRI